jgi:hypothetical protein
MIIAKQVLKNQYWILRDNHTKIGNIEATTGGFRVKINDNVQEFKTIRMVKQRLGLDFESPPKLASRDQYMVHGYPAGCKTYNAIYEVRQHLPLFTKTAKSKSWYCAGWYKILLNRTWKIVQSPKLITLNRYKYQGPFFSKEQAQ